jgi:hypothetical protein
MGRLMLFCVLLFYLSNVVPTQFATLLESVGETDDALSKLNKLRKVGWLSANLSHLFCTNLLCSCPQVVYDDDEDATLQKFGFRAHRIMNSSYHCALYTLNLFLLFWTDDVFEIILVSERIWVSNKRTDTKPRFSMARTPSLSSSSKISMVGETCVFSPQLLSFCSSSLLSWGHDAETIASSGWYDSGYRYLKAGAIEMLIRRYVSFHVLDKDLRVALKDVALKGSKSKHDIVLKENTASHSKVCSLSPSPFQHA